LRPGEVEALTDFQLSFWCDAVASMHRASLGMQRPLTGGPIAVANYSDFSQHSPILATLVSLFPLKTAEPWGLQFFFVVVVVVVFFATDYFLHTGFSVFSSSPYNSSFLLGLFSSPLDPTP